MTQHAGRKPFRADKSVSEGCWEKKFLWARNHSPQQLLARGGALGEGLDHPILPRLGCTLFRPTKVHSCPKC